MQKFFNLVIPGAVTGGIYAIMASGIVLTYQTSGIFNFAHGAVAFTVAFFYFQLNTGQDVHWVPALILSVAVFAPLLGLLLDRVLLRRLATAPVYARIVGTIGLLVALPPLTIWLVEALGDTVLGLDLPGITGESASRGHPPGIGPQPRAVWQNIFGWLGLDGIHLNSDQLAVFIASGLSAAALWYVVRRTRVGLEMRAVVDRESLASLRGVDAARSSAIAWVLTMVLAGLGGVLISPLFQLDDFLFTSIVLGSLAAVAFAGWRGFSPQNVSIPLAFAGGLALGVVQNLIAGYSDDILPRFVNELSGFKSSIPYILTLIILLVVAARERGRHAGSVADEAPAVDHRVGLPAWRRRLPWVVVTVVLLAFSLQWIDASWAQADFFEQTEIARGLCFALIFLSFVVVTGLGGMVSLAQATFVTAGGFTAGWALNRDWGIDIPFIASHGHLNFAIAALLGALLAAAVGALVAIPVRRLGAVALALATFAVAFVADLVIFAYVPIGHGSNGWTILAPTLDVPGLNWVNDQLLPGPQDTMDFSQPGQQVLLMLVLFGVVTLLIHALQRSASGRAMLAVRSSDVAARTSGIAPTRAKIGVFALSAAIAGLGGVMLGMLSFSAARSNAFPYTGLIWLAVAVTFGVRRPGGALLAGLAYTGTALIFKWIGPDYAPGVFEDLTAHPRFVEILFGIGAINLAKNPDGLLALVGHQRLERRLARERKARLKQAEAELVGEPVEELPPDAQPPPSGGERPTVAASASPALALEAIVAGYGEVEVLHGVDVAVESGTIVALLGANGAGKSTLCAVASGLLAPTRGRVLVDGRDLTDTPAFERTRLGVLLVPEARGVFPGLTVEENLRVLLVDEEDRAKAYARFPILDERRRQPAGLLSGGEQQMLSLAPALARPPNVFIADEPTLGLAPLAAEVVIEAIKELRDLGSAVLLVEEKAREVMTLADTVAFMELGRIVWIGPRADADADRLAASYLGSASPG